MELSGIEDDVVLALPARLETTTFFSPVIVVAPQIAIAINGVDFGASQIASAVNGLTGTFALA